MASREWFSARPPGGTESNATLQLFPKIPETKPNELKQIPGLNVKSFPTIPVESVKLLPNNANTNESNSNRSKVDADGYPNAMIINGVSRMPHSKENESYLLDQMINEAANVLANKAEPFKKETDKETGEATIVKKKVISSWNFSVYNLYNRANPYFIFFDYSGDPLQGSVDFGAYQVSLFPILPSITWNFKF